MSKCIKCSKAIDSDDRAAWDGRSNDACWDCFGRFGWKCFPEEPVRDETWGR